MSARITTAVNVRGERRGQTLIRDWSVTPQSCSASVCPSLALNRERSVGIHEVLTLNRVGAGTYTGTGAFSVALRCRGKTYPHGSRATYRITLRVAETAAVEGVAFARRVTASYVNPKRTDTTRCPLEGSHDAAEYAGTATSALPTAPVASFSTEVNAATDTAAFTDTSAPSDSGAPIVAQAWSFGDPASGAADVSEATTATHQFSGPGTYTVTLTVTDANGLTATSQQTVVVPGPPTSAFAFARRGSGTTYEFIDRSQPGIGAAPISGWRWTFVDPASGAANESTLENPEHEFTAPGPYQVTLTVTDSNGRQSTTSELVTVPPAPTASFTDSEEGLSSSFAFEDTSTPSSDGAAIVAWSWTFGDPASGRADSSSERDPTHAFLAPGTYTVTLTVADAEGSAATTSRQVVVLL